MHYDTYLHRRRRKEAHEVTEEKAVRCAQAVCNPTYDCGSRMPEVGEVGKTSRSDLDPEHASSASSVQANSEDSLRQRENQPE
jgi:hypothetical protein